jgi:hypothetical protein
LKLAGSGNVSEHLTSDLRRIMSAEFTKTVYNNLHLEQILSLSPAVLLKIEGKCAGFRAKSVHISGHLPREQIRETRLAHEQHNRARVLENRSTILG